jgi:hypothetical protein
VQVRPVGPNLTAVALRTLPRRGFSALRHEAWMGMIDT